MYNTYMHYRDEKQKKRADIYYIYEYYIYIYICMYARVYTKASIRFTKKK